MDVERYRDTFRNQGYVFVPNALESIDLGRVNSSYERMRRTTEAEWQQVVADGSYKTKGVYGYGPAAHVMLDIDRHDEVFLDLANNPKVIPILDAVVGPDLQVTEMIAHCHPAGTDAHIEWHRDWPPWSHPTEVLKAKVFYYVENVEADMGCFSVVPGSHRWDWDPSEAPPKNGCESGEIYSGQTLENMPGMKKLAAPAGTALIWDVALWHTATANTSRKDRHVVIYGYTHFWVKKWEDRTPPAHIIAWADTPQKRQLMGIHAVHGRASWDRQDVEYLPEHREIVAAKKF